MYFIYRVVRNYGPPPPKNAWGVHIYGPPKKKPESQSHDDFVLADYHFFRAVAIRIRRYGGK